MIGASVVAIKWAADAEEAANKFDVVFGEAAESVRKDLRSFAAETNQSSTDLEKLTGNIGDVVGAIDGMGNSTKDVSLQLTKLAVDASSFKNVSVDQAAQAFTSALTGEREALKSLGVVINEEMVKMKAFQLGLTKGGKDLSQSAKATATVALLTEKLSTSYDDARNTAGSFTNRVRGLWAAVRDLGREYGNQIIKGAGLAELFGTLGDKVRGLTNKLIETGVIARWAATFRSHVEALIDWIDRVSQGGLIRDAALEEMEAKIGSLMGRAGDALVDQVVKRGPDIIRAVSAGAGAVVGGAVEGAKKSTTWESLRKVVPQLRAARNADEYLLNLASKFGGSTGNADPKGSKTNPVHVADAGGPDSIVGVSSK